MMISDSSEIKFLIDDLVVCNTLDSTEQYKQTLDSHKVYMKCNCPWSTLIKYTFRELECWYKIFSPGSKICFS